MSIFDQKTILVTGGTGSFGKHFIQSILKQTQAQRVIVFSRDEFKQYEMGKHFCDEQRIRFFIGDVRDRERLYRAFAGVDFVVHAAALKHVPAAEYNPFEAVKTNIHGAQNVIDAAIDCGVQKVMALSTDKASSPINLYGATKLVSDKLFVDGNAYAGQSDTSFSVVRYGNVVGSRGSVIPFFQSLADKSEVPITHPDMTRFWITLDQAVSFVIEAFADMCGGEIFAPKIPSMKIVDLAKALCPKAKIKTIGMRPGEKLHEEIISVHDARRTIDVGAYYVIQPEMEWWDDLPKLSGQAVPEGFCYASDTNSQWLTVTQLRELAGNV